VNISKTIGVGVGSMVGENNIANEAVVTHQLIRYSEQQLISLPGGHFRRLASLWDQTTC